MDCKTNGRLAVSAPETPLIFTVEVPVAARLLAVNVKVLVDVAGFGLKEAETPLCNPTTPKPPRSASSAARSTDWVPQTEARARVDACSRGALIGRCYKVTMTAWTP
jgi:hypothetical protein